MTKLVEPLLIRLIRSAVLRFSRKPICSSGITWLRWKKGIILYIEILFNNFEEQYAG